MFMTRKNDVDRNFGFQVQWPFNTADVATRMSFYHIDHYFLPYLYIIVIT